MSRNTICINCRYQVAVLSCLQCNKKHYCNDECQSTYEVRMDSLSCPNQPRWGNARTIRLNNQSHSPTLPIGSIIGQNQSSRGVVTLPNIIRRNQPYSPTLPIESISRSPNVSIESITQRPTLTTENTQSHSGGLTLPNIVQSGSRSIQRSAGQHSPVR